MLKTIRNFNKIETGYKRNGAMLESVQEWFTNLIPGMADLSYGEILEVKVISRKTRSVREHLFETFKVLSSLDGVDV